MSRSKSERLFKLLFSFSGRIGRKCWWTGLGIGCSAAILGSLAIDPGVWVAEPQRAPSPCLALWDIAWVIPMTAITVKRFNDRDWPAWLGYATGITGILLILAEQQGFMLEPGNASDLEWAIFGAVVVLMLAAFVDNGFLRGTAGPNRYGADPLDRGGHSF
jgi:uncharacterized membrane protein YhaH (DUF805 family)